MTLNIFEYLSVLEFIMNSNELEAKIQFFL